MKRILSLLSILCLLTVVSCYHDHDGPSGPSEDASSFVKMSEIILEGGETAAEISAYDPKTKKLFVTNAVKLAIDVIDLSDPSNPVYIEPLPITAFGSGVNSVSVKNGMLAAAIESSPKTEPGKVVVWKTYNLHAEPEMVTVGALPDMVTFTPNGKLILCANEAESAEDLSFDPKGSVSIIDTRNFNVTTLDFTRFNGITNQLKKNGYRVFGQDADLAEDTEPEYIAVSDDSRYAWVTLQENNGIARINLMSKTIEGIYPLGFKDHNLLKNAMNPSDRDGESTLLGQWPVRGMYLPDAIAFINKGLTGFVITVNEGDSRLRPSAGDDEGDLYSEEERIKDLDLDPTAFPNADVLQEDDKLGRLKVTNTMGDTDGDGDYDELYSFGARSFSIWNSFTGKLIYDSGSELEKFVLEKMPSLYDDGRSDDKGVEPEAVTVGKVGRNTIAFVGLERADALVIVDVTNPYAPKYLAVLETGDAPECVLYIPANESPNGKSLLVVSAEGDGSVRVYQTL